MNQFKVIRTDGWNENIVGTFNTEQSARKYKDECMRYNTKNIYSYFIHEGEFKPKVKGKRPE